MASTAQLRQWWASYRCTTAKYVYVAFPGVDREWRLPVATPSADLWRAFAQVMTDHRYYFRESAGGTYNCRKIAGSDNYSLHAYAIALDLNPSRNPYNTSITDMPREFRDDLKAIRTTRGTQAFTWGGDWEAGTDPMHWQLNVSPSDTELEDDMPSPKDWTADDWKAYRDNTHQHIANSSVGAPFGGPKTSPNYKPMTSHILDIKAMIAALDSEGVSEAELDERVTHLLELLPDRVLTRLRDRLG